MEDTRRSESPQPSFEDGLKRLETIVKDLEQAEQPLEKALALFEEGTTLNKQLARQLDEAERRIEILSKDADGTPRVEPFDAPEKTEG